MATPIAIEAAGAAAPEAASATGATAARGASKSSKVAEVAGAAPTGGSKKGSSQKPSGSKSSVKSGPKLIDTSGKIPKVNLKSLGQHNLLLPMYILCIVILVFGTLVAPKDSKDDVHRLVVKGSALSLLFFILAIVSTGGIGAKAVTSVFGVLITLGYALNSSDIHNIMNWITGFYSKPGSKNSQIAKEG